MSAVDWDLVAVGGVVALAAAAWLRRSWRSGGATACGSCSAGGGRLGQAAEGPASGCGGCGLAAGAQRGQPGERPQLGPAALARRAAPQVARGHARLPLHP